MLLSYRNNNLNLTKNLFSFVTEFHCSELITSSSALTHPPPCLDPARGALTMAWRTSSNPSCWPRSNRIIVLHWSIIWWSAQEITPVVRLHPAVFLKVQGYSYSPAQFYSCIVGKHTGSVNAVIARVFRNLSWAVIGWAFRRKTYHCLLMRTRSVGVLRLTLC